MDKESLKSIETLVSSEGAMAAHSTLTQNALSMLHDSFAMIERSLAMTRSLHEMQLQGIDQWVNVCKFLLPVFATFATAGLTINGTGFNGTIALIIGGVGFIGFGILLFIQMNKRKAILSKQEKDLIKLNSVFEQYRQISDVQMIATKAEYKDVSNEDIRDALEKILAMTKVEAL